MLFLTVLLGLLSVTNAQFASVELTGHARRDFNGEPGVQNILDAGVRNEGGDPDVAFPEAYGNGRSGFDVTEIFMLYDVTADVLQIGVDCFGICGDADGNDVDGTSDLMAMGVIDHPDLGGSETVALFLDFNLDVTSVLPSFIPRPAPWDVVIGVPGAQPNNQTFLPCQPEGATWPLPFNATGCFGMYTPNPDVPAGRHSFLSPLVVDGVSIENNNPTPNEDQPSWEWSITGFSLLRASFMEKDMGMDDNMFVRKRQQDEEKYAPFTVLGLMYSGSEEDGEIGDDWVGASEDAFDFFQVDFPCSMLDVCGVCMGNGTTCNDCSGTPNGGKVVDECGVCDGPGAPCPTTTAATTTTTATTTAATTTTAKPTTTTTKATTTAATTTTTKAATTTTKAATTTTKAATTTKDATETDSTTADAGNNVGSDREVDAGEVESVVEEPSGLNTGEIVGLAVLAALLLLALVFCMLTAKINAAKHAGNGSA